jgi:hypothetical protein
MAKRLVLEVEYDSERKIFFVKAGDIAFVVSSPFLKTDHPPLPIGTVPTRIFHEVDAHYWRTGVPADGNAILKARPELRTEIQGTINEWMIEYVKSKFANLQLSNAAPSYVRCVSIDPPTFEICTGDLVARISFFGAGEILVKSAERNGSIDNASPLVQTILGANRHSIFELTIHLGY